MSTPKTGYIEYLGFILDQPEYRHISITPHPDGAWKQEVIARCPICGSKVRVSSIMPEVLGTIKEMVWYCRCSNDKCSSEGLLVKTDNPVKLSILDALIQEFIERAREREHEHS